MLRLVILFVVASVSSTVTGKKCDDVEHAIYNTTSRRCECEEGYEGSGELCCVLKNKNDVCYFSGDPYLHSIHGVTVPVNLPCSICINIMEGKTTSRKACKFEIMTSTNIGQSGAMYNSILKIGVSINKRRPRYFTIYGGQVIDSLTNSSVPMSSDMKGSVSHDGATLSFMYSNETGFWIANGCGNEIKTRLLEDIDKGTPGVCMLAGKGTTQSPASDGNLCNLNSDFKPIHNDPLQLGVAESAILQRKRFDSEQLISHPDYDQVCKDTIDPSLDLLEFCSAPNGRSHYKVCGPLLYNSVIRSCLYHAGIAGPNLAKLFGHCLIALCGFDQQACDAYKSNTAVLECIPSIADCDKWMQWRHHS